MKKTLLALIFAVVSTFAFAQSGQEVLQRASNAAQEVVRTYKESGISGVTRDVQKCYNEDQNLLYCFYMDYSGRILDATMIAVYRENMGVTMPANEYFADEAFYERAMHYIYIPQNSSMDEANRHLDGLYPILNAAIYNAL